MLARKATFEGGAVSKHQEQIVAAAEGKVDEEVLGAAFAKGHNPSL